MTWRMAKEALGLAPPRRGFQDRKSLPVVSRRSGAPMGYFFWYMLSTFGGYHAEDLGVISWLRTALRTGRSLRS